ncbi:hypothetical protein QBC46DRAFT_380256 [Diplogelasinospora grovesii]|uniref:Uncharacterized protein n=1 Tax=Diplogelasinospora grovesii TaxID=303347 RepID=A0AAN6NDY1_9PEZI|nr:hypothetical protein QBC46DRAFT_380256 [Diplogelasinospora grovesii]
MSELSKVCLRCRARILAASRVQQTSWQQPRNSSYSTAAGDVGPQHDDQQSIRAATPAPTADAGWKLRKIKTNNATRPRRAAFADSSSSLAIFKNIVGEQQSRDVAASESTAATSPSTGQMANLGLMKDVAKMQEILGRDGDAGVTAAYGFFETNIYPQISQAGSEVPQILIDQLSAVLFRRLLIKKAESFDSPELPTVTRISEIMLELGLLKPPNWAILMIQLLQHICRVSTFPTDYTSIESYENAMGRRDALLHDLLGAWKVFTVPRFTALRVGDAAKAAKQGLYPSGYPRAHSSSDRWPGPQRAFAALFPQYTHLVLHRPTWAAIATYALLTDPVNRNQSVLEKATPFLRMMGQVLFASPRPKRNELKTVFGPYPDLHDYCLSRWPAVIAVLSNRMAALDPRSFTRPPRSVDNIYRQFDQALKRGNLEAMKKAWQEFWGMDDVPDEARVKELLAENVELFDQFIMAYMGLKQPELAIDVWNRMQRIGVKPTIKTWNSMIDGCTRAKNPHGIKTVWQRLVASGIELDTTVWTARISGLIRAGDPEAGLAALNEMAKIWEDSRKGQGNSFVIAVKPTIEPVNAALSGLLRLNRMSTAKTVLGWAARQGIAPDIYTFNTLLRPMVRKGQHDEVDKIFQMMRDMGIEADAATFTILLEGALADVGAESPERQVQIVTKFIRDMEAAGVKANMQTYAKMIYVLLQEGGDNAEAAVKAVLAHIWSNAGLELTSHIYTMLAEHYFSRDPPDTVAVTSLIESRNLHDNRDIDRIFWERVIKGYSQAGETDRALHIYNRIFAPSNAGAGGTIITFSTLYELLFALVRADKMEEAAKLVKSARNIMDATAGGGGGGGGPPEQIPEGAAARGVIDADIKTGRFWKHRFWHLADRYGLLQEDLVAPFHAANTADLGM